MLAAVPAATAALFGAASWLNTRRDAFGRPRRRAVAFLAAALASFGVLALALALSTVPSALALQKLPSWLGHGDFTSETYGAIVRSEPLQGKGNVVRRMFADIEADAGG